MCRKSSTRRFLPSARTDTVKGFTTHGGLWTIEIQLEAMRSSRALVTKQALSMADLLSAKMHDSGIVSSGSLSPSVITLNTELGDPISSHAEK